MKITLLLLSIFFLLSQRKEKDDFDYVISNSKIINTQDGSILSGYDILIKKNVIIRVAPHQTSYSNSVKVINGSELYAMPALWDMHVHAVWPDWFPLCNLLMVSNGVSGFREMWGYLKYADTIREKMLKGEIPFQRFIIPGGLIDGNRPIWPGSQIADDAKRAIELVDSLYNAGADFIKVYTRLKPDAFYAIAKRCKELNLKFVGHVPEKVKLVDAINAGMYSIEHLTGFAEAFSDVEDSLFSIINNIDYSTSDVSTIAMLREKRLKLLIQSKMVPEKAKRIFETLQANNTWLVPTMVVKRNMAYMEELSKQNDPRLIFLPSDISSSWNPKNDFRTKNRTPEQWEAFKTLYKNDVDLFNLICKNYSLLLAGTDFPNPYSFPGSGLHDEMELMVQAGGMTPLQALQSATLNAAKYLQKTDSLGTIAAGKYADILLLDRNPLTNISNIRTIHSLFIDGKFYSAKDLEALKQSAKMMAAKMNEVNK